MVQIPLARGLKHIFLYFIHHFFTAAEEGRALMEFRRLYVQDTPEAVAGLAVGLFGDKRHGITFVE